MNMRSVLTTVVTTAVLFLAPLPVAAQHPVSAPTTPTAGLPQAPIPYTQIRAKAPTATPVARTGPDDTAAAPPPLEPVALRAFVDGWMSDAMAREHIAGAAVVVVQGGQGALNKAMASPV